MDKYYEGIYKDEVFPVIHQRDYDHRNYSKLKEKTYRIYILERYTSKSKTLDGQDFTMLSYREVGGGWSFERALYYVNNPEHLELYCKHKEFRETTHAIYDYPIDGYLIVEEWHEITKDRQYREIQRYVILRTNDLLPEISQENCIPPYLKIPHPRGTL